MSLNNSIVATYANDGLVKADARRLRTAGFDMRKLTVAGKDWQGVGELEDIAVVDEFGALNPELIDCIPQEDIHAYEEELKAGRLLLVAYGTADEITQAKGIIDLAHPEDWGGRADATVYYGCSD